MDEIAIWVSVAIGILNMVFFAFVLRAVDRTDKQFRDEFARSRQEGLMTSAQQREELANALTRQHQALMAKVAESSASTENRLETMRSATDHRLEAVRSTMEQRMSSLQEAMEAKLVSLQSDNNIKLEQMRLTVDEKLHATLEQRLGESFKLVGERLETLHKGLGEMQVLASGVGDLKKVLTNVKTRGTLGEVQLDALLEQSLSPEQYERNVVIRAMSTERVDFVVKLPDKTDGHRHVLLPIDAKFPLEDYQRLVDAQEQADSVLAAEAMKQLETRLKAEAKSIRDKYIDAPRTTEFAILFLPLEGLYAEVLRRPGIWDTLQRDYRVIITGPTTLTALLNSLQMGFRTLAIQQRTSEVWHVLSTVKAEFGKFGDVLDKTQKKLQEASNTLDTAAVRTRAIERKLRDVQELSPAQPSLAESQPSIE
jgi:DNA recombination protein RmuC